MNTIDLSPLYRSSIGFDRIGSMLDSALRSDHASDDYPSYNIEMLDSNKYCITLAVAGFKREQLSIEMEQGVLTIRGTKQADNSKQRFLHQGITERSFERKFNLAEFVEVTGADLSEGLLRINLIKEVPEAMKPKRIEIRQSPSVLEDKSDKGKKD